MEFQQILFDYVQFAFDNEKELLREFVDTSILPNATDYEDVISCDTEVQEFYMSGSLCLLSLTYFDADDCCCEHSIRIITGKYLDWVYKVNGGLLHE